MKHLRKTLTAALALAALAQTAQAADESNCEVVVVKVVKAEDGSGEMHIQSFRSSEAFIASALDDNPDHITEIEGGKITGLLCTRNDVIPTVSDYPLLATGIPLSLSQNFDSDDTDSLTVKWIDGDFKYKYEGYPLSDEALTTLRARLAGFTERGLNDWARGLNARAVMAQDLENGASNVINTAAARPVHGPAAEGIDRTEAETIWTHQIGPSEATKLNIQTEIETEE